MLSFNEIKLDSERPVYIQIILYIKIQIHLGVVNNGEELPSRRDLAGTLGINPNTVQKAYNHLEEEGLLSTGNNIKSILVITEENKIRIKTELTHEMVMRFIGYAKSINLSFKDTINLFSELWD